MTTPPAFDFTSEFYESIENLPDADAGRVVKAMGAYVFHMETPEFHPTDEKHLACMWPMMASKLNRCIRAYRDKCVKNAYAGDSGAYPEVGTMTYVSWFEWRKARYKDIEDPILYGYTLADMMIFDSLRAKKQSKQMSGDM